jgi:hypothetical protein
VERLSVLSRGVRGGLVVEKTWTGSTWETLRVSHFPPTLRRLGYLREQNSSRWRLSELLQHVPSFGIESHQKFMSQSDTNNFLRFAGRS